MVEASNEETVACTLGPGELSDRRAVWQRLAERALRELRSMPHGVRLVFAASQEVEGQLRELVRLEADCCSFADWRVRRSGDELIVDVTAAGDGVTAVQALFSVS